MREASITRLDLTDAELEILSALVGIGTMVVKAIVAKQPVMISAPKAVVKEFENIVDGTVARIDNPEVGSLIKKFIVAMEALEARDVKELSDIFKDVANG